MLLIYIKNKKGMNYDKNNNIYFNIFNNKKINYSKIIKKIIKRIKRKKILSL